VVPQPTSAADPPVPVVPAPSVDPVASIKEILPVVNSPSKVPVQNKEGNKDAYADPEALNLFVQEVERFEKVVEGLTNKTLNGPTPLDLKWKELQELQVRPTLSAHF
jgi:tyrosine-protein phosphatase non-receptor type 23